MGAAPSPTPRPVPTGFHVAPLAATTGGVRTPAFRALLRALDAGPLHVAPHVTLHAEGDAAMAEVHAAIAAARTEVLLETYILRDDRIGDAMQAALAAAVQRGVRVSVLADAVGSRETREAYWVALRSAGVAVRLFPRSWRHPISTLQRDHRKIIVVDRRVAFTGGMNIGEEYGLPAGSRDALFRDGFVRVDGSVAEELAAVFAEGWDRAGGPSLPGLAYVSWREAAEPGSPGAGWRSTTLLRDRWRARRARRRERRTGRRVQRPLEEPAASGATAVVEGAGVPAGMESTSGATVLVMDLRPGRAVREAVGTMVALAAAARERLWITTPYFAPPDRVIDLLVAAARRGVDVRLLLPGPTDVPVVRHAGHATFARLLAGGVRIWEYQAAILHAKALVVDGHASVVGSSNLDFRSFRFNAECNLVLLDDRCAQALERQFEADLAQSEEIDAGAWSRRSLRHAVLDLLARSLRWAL